MKLLIASLSKELKKLSPEAICAIGLVYVLAVGLVDQVTPNRVGFTLLYVLGAVFVGWGAGKYPAGLISVVSAVLILAHDWPANRGTAPVWITLWNLTTRLIVVAAAGWLAAEVARLTRNLGSLVEERTAQWKALAEQHQATSTQLAETLAHRKQTEEVLQTQARILEEMAEGMIATDSEGIIQMTNPAADRLMGYAPGELLGKSITLLSGLPAPETAAKFQEIVEHFQHQDHWFGELPQRRKDGSLIVARVEITRIQVGQRVLLAAFYQDITAGKRADEALRLSQRQLAEAMDLARLANWEYDVASGLYTFDDRFFKLYATTPDREDGPHMSPEVYVREFLYPEDAHFVLEEIQKALATSDPNYTLQLEHRIRRRDGEVRHLAVRVRITKDAAGRTIKIRGVNQDITERKSAEEKLAEALDLNQKMLAASPMGIAAYKASGECVFCNEALACMIGGTLEEIRQGNFRRVEGWNMSSLQRLAQEALEHGKVGAGEFYVRTRFGKALWIDAHAASFTRGGQLHLLFMGYDISERKRLEQQILEISDREQARLGQDLHDGLCQELVSLAFDANALESQLSAQRHPEAATARRIADILDQAITEARQLSRGLFPLRLEAQGLPSALEELARATRERFQVECFFESDGQMVLKDRAAATHLYRIAQEAVTNAIKHARAQNISIQLLVDRNSLELKVADDGSGIPARTRRNSAGMGLHIMDYRARSIGGNLQISAGLNSGTVVTCYVAWEQRSQVP